LQRFEQEAGMHVFCVCLLSHLKFHVLWWLAAFTVVDGVLAAAAAAAADPGQCCAADRAGVAVHAVSVVH
jgi:hypothetical protein